MALSPKASPFHQSTIAQGFPLITIPTESVSKQRTMLIIHFLQYWSSLQLQVMLGGFSVSFLFRDFFIHGGMYWSLTDLIHPLLQKVCFVQSLHAEQNTFNLKPQSQTCSSAMSAQPLPRRQYVTQLLYVISLLWLSVYSSRFLQLSSFYEYIVIFTGWF